MQDPEPSSYYHFGSLSSNTKSPLSVLNLSDCDCDASIRGLEELLLSCCSLQHLVMEGVYLTPKMSVGICKNGKTLQTLNLDSIIPPRHVASHHVNYFQEIIRCCQELKEVDLGHEDCERDFNADFDLIHLIQFK